jgi:hypothetical protein
MGLEFNLLALHQRNLQGTMTGIDSNMGPQIVVLDRGFVYYGRNVAKNLDETITIEGAKNIRRWGTTSGLGQLAKDGPQPNTKLDETGTVVAPLRAVIQIIQCSRAW